jgi:arginase family enzyme
VKTTAVFFPFDLFGSPGSSAGANLLADAFRELVADNAREKVPTRADVYRGQVRSREVAFETVNAYQSWRRRGRQAVRRVLRQGHFLFWITGNHLGVLPVYEELSTMEKTPKTLVVQLDAHLDVQNFSECTSELSHGNFLLHCRGSLPAIINVGHRDLLMPPEYVRQYYRQTFAADAVARSPQAAVESVRKAARDADRIFFDLDCDVLDPAFFPAAAHAVPFGLSPQLVLQLLDAAWSERVAGLAISEFEPGRDRNDQSLATLVWLMEYTLLKRHELLA